MLLDLGRNDVGRVSKIGSVRVTDSFAIERYSRVMAHFVYGLAQSATRVEAFLFATRLTRVTRHLMRRRGSAALAGLALLVGWSRPTAAH